MNAEINARRRPLRERRAPASPIVDDDTVANEFAGYENPDPPTGNTTFPPPPNPYAPPLSSSPSSAGSRTGVNALTRALSIATKKLFGSTSARTSPHYRDFTPISSSPRRQQIISTRMNGLGLDVDGQRDSQEDELLAELEELAQKTEVLTHWADEMYEYVKAVPQSALWFLLSIGS